jgi:hypothetical protein
MRNYILMLIFIIVFFLYLSSERLIEGFDEQISYERQQRAGPLTSYDIERRQLIQSEFPTIPNYFLPFKRFYIEIFSEINFQNKIAELKDSPEQLLAIRTRMPIKSFRIRSVPNDNWRFLQFFSVGMYSENYAGDLSKEGMIYHVPHRNGKSVDYKVRDTSNEFQEGYEWMNSNDNKVVYFTTNVYNPLGDLK